MPIAKARGYKGKADVLFSKIIRAKGYCQKCGSADWLQCAHIISRRYAATRCDLANAWVLCAACHRRLTDWPREHSQFITETIGSETYDELKLRAETVTKVDWQRVYEQLRQIAAMRGIK